MPYTSEWLVPDHVVLFTLEGHINGEDLILLSHECIASARAINPAKLHLLIDCRPVTKYPLNMKVLTSDKMPRGSNEPNMGWVVVVASNNVVRLLVDTVLRLARAQYHTCSTLEAGISFLQKRVSFTLSGTDTAAEQG